MRRGRDRRFTPGTAFEYPSMMLHPQARALLDLIEQSGLPPTHTLCVGDARVAYRERRHFTQPPPPEIGCVRDLQASGPSGSIPLRLYRPPGAGDDAVLPVLVYYHGGGWVMGDLDTHDTLCRELAKRWVVRWRRSTTAWRRSSAFRRRWPLHCRDALGARPRRRVPPRSIAPCGGRRQRRRQPCGGPVDGCATGAICRSHSNC